MLQQYNDFLALPNTSQKFSLDLKYKRGREMVLADTLSRAPLASVHACDFSQEFEEVDQTTSLAMPTAQVQRIQDTAYADPVMITLRDTRLARP